MNETTSSGPSEPSSTRPGRPAAQGEIRTVLQQLFPDLDPDVVCEVLGLPGDSGRTSDTPASNDEEAEK